MLRTVPAKIEGEDMKKVLLVKYGEIAMRGKNRYLVENRLITIFYSINRLKDYEGYKVYKEQGRILVLNEITDVDYDTVVPLAHDDNITRCNSSMPLVGTVDDQSIENLREVACHSSLRKAILTVEFLSRL